MRTGPDSASRNRDRSNEDGRLLLSPFAILCLGSLGRFEESGSAPDVNSGAQSAAKLHLNSYIKST